jgi:micrococcal nuclease
LLRDSNRKSGRRWLPLIFSLILASCGFWLSACEGKSAGPPTDALVMQVVDGDTVILAGGAKVRVLGIDAPELERDAQPADFLAHKAKAALTELTLDRKVGLEYDRLRYDHYGRLLAYLFLPDHNLVAAELVRRGLARVYLVEPNMRYREILLAAQQEAIGESRGVWQQLLKQDESYYLGNRNTLRLHRPECPLGAQMAQSNQTRFTSLKEAYLQGYSPCRSCKP